MRHGHFSKISGNFQSTATTTAASPAVPAASPFGDYSSLFDASPAPALAATDPLMKTIQEIAAARSSGVDGLPPDSHGAIPAGYTYFGQLVVHDLTHSIAAKGRSSTPSALQNLSTPNLDLDTIYGGGPVQCPHLYQPPHADAPRVNAPGVNAPRDEPDYGQHLFYLGRTAKPAYPENWRLGQGLPFDLPRIETGSRGIAETTPRVSATPLVHDERNDDNLILAQLTAQFLLVHNTVANYLRRNGNPSDGGGKLTNRQSFDLARHFLLKAYRRIVIHDFLQRLLLPQVYKGLLAGKIASHDSIPVEFVFGAARVGHAMVRGAYTINAQIDQGASRLGQLMSFSGHALNPTLPLPADWVVDWHNLLEMPSGEGIPSKEIVPQNARRISPFLAPTFVYGELTGRSTGLDGSLSFHDLWRCYERGIPTGQECARRLFKPDSQDILSGQSMLPTAVFTDLHPAGNLVDILNTHPDFLRETPLSYYLLQEAAVLGNNGRHLGPLGSCIYASTILHALETSPPIPANQSGLAFKDLLTRSGITRLPDLLGVPDLSDVKLANIISETLG